MRFRIFLLLIFITTYTVQAQDQSKSDSLLYLLKTATSDTAKVGAYNKLFMLYVADDTAKAIYYSNCILELSKKINYKKGMMLYQHGMGIYNYYLGNYSLSIDYYLKAVVIREELGDMNGQSAAYNNIGIDYASQGDYNKAIEYYQKSLKIDEGLGKKWDVSQTYQNIGVIHSYQGNYKTAIEYYQKSLNIIEELISQKNSTQDIEELNIGRSSCYINMGLIYYYQKEYSVALKYFENSLKITRQYGDKQGTLQGFNNIGMIYDDTKDYPKAIEYYQKALNIIEEIGDKGSMTVVLNNIATLKIQLEDYNSAIIFSEKSLKIAEDIGSIDDERLAYVNLYRSYRGLKNFEKALDYYEYSRALHDSIFNLDKHKQFSEMETKYQTEKRQKEIELLEKDKVLQASEVRSQKIQKYSFIAGFVLMLVLVVVIFKGYKDKKKSNNLLALQKHEIEEKNEELNQQNEEISAQRDSLENLNKILENKNEEITTQKEHIEEIHLAQTDSIRYAEQIQKAVLSAKQHAELLLPEHFILFKPRDIVSGDFYWISRIDKWLLLTVADCTGHGVPGAFMSLLGITFLNEIVRKKEVTKASEVLDQLRGSIIDSLQQKGLEHEQKDGMDICFCAIDTETLVLQYAGAYNSLYIITSEMGKPTLTELLPDKQPVGININMQPFKNNEFQLHKGDVIYLTSDGYKDQFGGPENKKIKIKKLKELFIYISQKPMNEQRGILDHTFEEWKGEHKQIDDVTIMGLRF